MPAISHPAKGGRVMLHDPEMECTCDGEDCNESVFLPMSWYVGGYDLTDSDAKALLENHHDWLVDGDHHYCPDCKKEEE